MINHITCTLKILTHFCFIKQKIKIKSGSVKVVYLRCFSSENVLMKHKEDCLSISGQQSINLEKGTIKFNNYFKQLPVPFKIYADFQCNLKNVECYEGTYTNKHVPCSYAYKDVCIDDRFSKHVARKTTTGFTSFFDLKQCTTFSHCPATTIKCVINAQTCINQFCKFCRQKIFPYHIRVFFVKIFT